MSTRRVVFLHVGGPKTGTTFIQRLMWANRDVLREAGVGYPGRGPAIQFFAAQDLLDAVYHGHQDPRIDGAWARTVEELRSGPPVGVFSHETLSLAGPGDVTRALADLDFADVHVVYTMRDLARQIPSVWQEDLKNRHAVTFARFVRGLRGADPDPHWLVGLFWRFQDPVSILARWAAVLPPERVHVLTVPPPGAPSGLLWERFATTVGIDPTLDLRLPPPANPSLGVVEANVLRRVNERLGEDFDWPRYERTVKTTLAGSILGARGGQIALRLPAQEYPWVIAWAHGARTGLQEAGYDVVGDLADIVPASPPDTGPAADPPPTPARHPDDASPTELLEAALDAVAGLVRDARTADSDGAAAGTPTAPPPELLPALVLFRLGVQRLSRDHAGVALLRAGWARARAALGAVRR